MTNEFIKSLCYNGPESVAKALRCLSPEQQKQYIEAFKESIHDYTKLVEDMIALVYADTNGVYIGAKWTVINAELVRNGYENGDLMTITDIKNKETIVIDGLFGTNIEGLNEIAKWEGK